MKMIPWWSTNFGNEEIKNVSNSIRNKCISQGRVTEDFERKISEFLEVDHVIAVTNGSSALLISLMAIGISPGDEVIIPNRTWIATAHAVHILGAKAIIIDTQKDLPLIDVNQIESMITSKTKAIIPVHMNGRSCDMSVISKIAKKYKLFVIEDAAQAIGSKNSSGFLGTQSDAGCFSLSVAKAISTGQGGFVVSKNSEIANKIRAIRTHGVENVKDPDGWEMPGFNFRFNDILASIGIEQLKRLPGRLDHLRNIYEVYSNNLKNTAFSQIPVDLNVGEIPIYNEYLVKNRSNWVDKLDANGIETRPFYPAMSDAKYLETGNKKYTNSEVYSNCGIYLPSGPSQDILLIKKAINIINNL